MSKISATIVADSINSQGDRLTSLLITFPRILLSEVNTHRMLSKNTSSSRAIPFNKMVEAVQNDPFIPIAWQKDHKGMQGTEYFNTHASITKDYNQDIHYGFWMDARDEAIRMATCLHDEGLTKQLCNRLLEPFMWTTMLITGSKEGWDNFYSLRNPVYELKAGTTISNSKDLYFKSYKDLLQYIKNNSNNQSLIQEFENKSILEKLQINKGQAEIHMMTLAESIYDAMNESIPNKLSPNEWHIPFGDKINDGQMAQAFSPNKSLVYAGTNLQECKVKIATARCARLSYMNFDGEIDYEKDIKLHDHLLESGHMSPFEHCCRAVTEEEYNENFKGKEKGWFYNLKGFKSYRYIIESL